MSRYRPLSTRPIWSVMRDMTTERGYRLAGAGPCTPGQRAGVGVAPDGRVRPGAGQTGSVPDAPAAAASEEAVRPWTLGAAAGLVSLEALVEAVAVAGRSSLTPGLRAGLVLCIALKWAAAYGVLRRSAGAALGLLLLQGTTVVAAFGAVDSPAAVRLALGVVAVASITLLLASLHAFPSPDLPRP